MIGHVSNQEQVKLDIVELHYYDEVNMKVLSEPDIRQELREYFKFRPLSYQFNPRYKSKVWDGYIYLYNPFKPILYVGLIQYIAKFCEDRGYELRIDPKLIANESVDDDYAYQLAKMINSPFQPRDYQNEYVNHCIRNNRTLVISPTSSGKSYIIHLIQQHYYNTEEIKTLIVVDRIGLVYQMASDFVSYGVDESHIHKILSGQEKNTNAPITISTWQSIVNMPKEWFDQFGLVLGDEAHNYKAKSLIKIMENLTKCKYRFGFTGTISSKSQVNKLILEGLFGPIKKVVSTKDLIDEGTLAEFRVKGLVLNHSMETKKHFRSERNKIFNSLKDEKKKKNFKYQYELAYINSNDNRNNFIKNLLWSLEGQNNLVLFDRVEKHGAILEALFKKEGRELHFIHGGVLGEERERIRNLVENDPIKRHDILASYGTFSTGIILKKLDNIIFASGSKSEIRVLQSIGRSLRKGNGADLATLYDITDNLTLSNKENYTLDHFRERIEIYAREKLPFKIFTIDI